MTKLRNDKKTRRDRGFSLIELMVVLVILGLIVAVVLPRLGLFMDKGGIQATKLQLKQIGAALLAYKADVGSYPTTEQGLKALVENVDSSNTNWKGPYLESRTVPKDAWKSEFIYVCPGTHQNDYDLASKGQDQKENTADDLNNWTE